jgi:hypothetical protein
MEDAIGDIISEIIDYDPVLDEMALRKGNIDSDNPDFLNIILEIVQLRDEVHNKTEKITEDYFHKSLEEILELCKPVDDEYTELLEELIKKL